MHFIRALKNGKSIDIEDVESGLGCDCICAICGENLIARKGNKRVHHFAHKANSRCVLARDITRNRSYSESESLSILKGSFLLLKGVNISIPRERVDDLFNCHVYLCLDLHNERLKSFDACVEDVLIDEKIEGFLFNVVLKTSEGTILVDLSKGSISDKKLEKVKESGYRLVHLKMKDYNIGVSLFLRSNLDFRNYFEYFNCDIVWYNDELTESAREDIKEIQNKIRVRAFSNVSKNGDRYKCLYSDTSLCSRSFYLNRKNAYITYMFNCDKCPFLVYKRFDGDDGRKYIVKDVDNKMVGSIGCACKDTAIVETFIEKYLKDYS